MLYTRKKCLPSTGSPVKRRPSVAMTDLLSPASGPDPELNKHATSAQTAKSPSHSFPSRKYLNRQAWHFILLDPIYCWPAGRQSREQNRWPSWHGSSLSAQGRDIHGVKQCSASIRQDPSVSIYSQSAQDQEAEQSKAAAAAAAGTN